MSQPNNWLINHLGLTNFWFSCTLISLNYSRYTFLNILNINYYLRILFKNGIIYTFHLFYHRFFFQFITILTLPIYITEWTFSKFYRWYKIKNLKKHFLLRKYLQYMHLSMVYFFRLNNWLLVSLFIYIPHIIKWKTKKYVFTRWVWSAQTSILVNYYNYYLINYYNYYLINWL